MSTVDEFQVSDISRGIRLMDWGDVVPFGHYATWACEPNASLDEIKALLRKTMDQIGTGSKLYQQCQAVLTQASGDCE